MTFEQLKRWQVSDRKRLLAIFLFGLMLAACQPAPEERFSRALAYYDDAEYRSAMLELRNAVRQQPDFPEARFLLGLVSYQLADFLTAKSEFERALSYGLDRPDVWENLGRSLIALGDAKAALERVVPMLSIEAATASQLVLIGDVFLALGNTEEATTNYEGALAIDSSMPGALIGQAVIAAQNNKPQDAAAKLQEALNLNPKSALVWRAQGNFLWIQGDLDRATDALAKSMELESKSTPLAERLSTRVNLITTFIDMRDFELAIDLFEEVSAEFPRYPLIHYLRGRIAFGTGDYDLAQTELLEYLAQVPRDARGQAVLGAVNFSKNKFRQAEMYLIQAVRARVGGESIRRLLAETQLRLNKPEEAMIALLAARAQGQSDPMLLAMLGRAEISLGDTESAIRYFQESVAVNPNDPATMLALAATYLQADRAANAIELLQSMQELPGSEFRREALLIGAYLREGQRNRAVTAGDRLLANNPDAATAHSLVGVLHNTIGNKDRAIRLFDDALNLDPQNLSALYNLGTISLSAGELEAAAVRFTTLLNYHPAYIPGLVSLAALLQQQGNLGRMRPVLAAAIERVPGSIAPRVLLARVELAERQYDVALTVISDARESFPEDAGLDHLEGVIRTRSGDTAQALIFLARAAAGEPDNAPYVYDLAAARIATEDFEGAASSARIYRALRPDDVQGLSLLVNAENRAGTPNDARAAVEAFVRENPDNAVARLLAGDIELMNGAPSQALIHYEKSADIEWTRAAAIQISKAHQAAGSGKASDSLRRWVKDNPNDYDARMMYAQLLESNGAVSEAVYEYERLHRDGVLNAIGLNNLAWQYSLRGRDDAIELAQQAHELDPNNGNITDTLGWILYEKGELDSSIELLRLAVEQAPSSPEVRFHLAAALARSGDTFAARKIIDELLASDAVFSSRTQAEQLARSL